MKKSSRARLLTFVLALCLCTTMVTPAFAAGGRHSSSSGSRWSFSSWWNGWWNRGDDNTSNSDKSDSSSEPELKLVEDQSTVTEGTDLRASTYAVTSDDAATNDATEDTDTVKYFPVTLYDYDTKTINTATHNAEAEKAYNNGETTIDTWEGIYFSSGNPVNGGGTYDKAAYLGDNTGTVKLSESTPIYDEVPVSYDSYYNEYSDYENNDYYTDNTGKTLVETLSCKREWSRSDWAYTYTWTVNGTSLEKSTSKLITLYKKTTTDSKTYTSTAYANWNKWGGNVTDATATGNYIYSGLVEDKLDKTNNIVFTKTEPGLFRSDDTNNSYGKTIYTNVGLPFEYDATTNYYTFNSNKMSAHFTSGNEAGSNKNLTYGTTAQTISDLSAQGKSDNTSWLPFNKGTSVTKATADYHFGMQATIPFSMTANGKMNVKESDAEDIKFEFSGDDDVWVFVDGTLVLDIGGIHNEMAGSMNFATNSWVVEKSSDNTNTNNVGDMNGDGGTMSGQLFNDENGDGVLGTDRTTFAATTSHTLTVFYLERGAGASNCKIKFNLPMEDSVSVKKIVSDTDSAGAALDEDIQESVNNQSFTFKLYRDGNPVAKTNYIILDESNQPIGTATTDKNGTFTLKNNQTAKFVGQISSTDGNTYYVEEVQNDGWETPVSSYTAVAAGSYKQTEAANGTTSAKVKVIGSNEANDHLDYTFTNTLTHVNEVDIKPQDDKIVIDYGLPVEIDPLANDVVQHATKSITNVTEGKFGTATISKDGQKITYQLNKQLTDVETLTYEVTATPTSSADTAKTETANIYIIPATSMYYEENFSNMMTFSTSWTPVGESNNAYQEPGVVGTTNDSPYGSDHAYMDSTGDSCGTSMYVSTDDGKSKSFRYTFTGTGTSFFARTTNNSGYMRVVVTDQDDKEVKKLFRNTKYVPENGEASTLYNIPVFTWNAENYGTYTVTVTVAKSNAAGTYGTDFWVDGVRVMNPLDSDSGSSDIAQSAYATDGESNMTFATLREKLLDDTEYDENGELVWNTSKGFVVFTDSNGTITKASEYESNGPKEEVYLAKEQKVSFSLTNWDPDTNHLYLGIKAPMGSGTVRFGNGDSIEVKNTVDCYYDVAKFATITEVDGKKVATLTITNPGDAIISLTNIKVTGDPYFVIIPPDDKNGDDETDPEENISAGESTDESPESEDADVTVEE